MSALHGPVKIHLADEMWRHILAVVTVIHLIMSTFAHISPNTFLSLPPRRRHRPTSHATYGHRNKPCCSFVLFHPPHTVQWMPEEQHAAKPGGAMPDDVPSCLEGTWPVERTCAATARAAPRKTRSGKQGWRWGTAWISFSSTTWQWTKLIFAKLSPFYMIVIGVSDLPDYLSTGVLPPYFLPRLFQEFSERAGWWVSNS